MFSVGFNAMDNALYVLVLSAECSVVSSDVGAILIVCPMQPAVYCV